MSLRSALLGLALAGPLAVTGLAPGAAQAQSETPQHCGILGQMAVSTWLDLLTRLSRGPEAASLDPLVARFADLTSSFGALGCDQAALGAALECLPARAGETLDPAALARICMEEAGLAKP